MKRQRLVRACPLLSTLLLAGLLAGCSGAGGAPSPPASPQPASAAAPLAAVSTPDESAAMPSPQVSAHTPQPAATWSVVYPPAVDRPTVIAEGFSVEGGGGSYALLVENPLATPVALRGEVRFLTAGGEQRLERNFSLPYVAPRERAGWSDALPAAQAGGIVRMEATLAQEPPADSGSAAIALTLGDTPAQAPPVATVLLINHNAEAVEGARLSVVAFGADGGVLGGGARTAPSLPPHLDTQLVVPLTGVSQPARVEAFVSFTPQTRFGAEP